MGGSRGAGLRSPRAALVCAAFAGILILGASHATGQAAGLRASRARLALFVSPSGSDRKACTEAAPCRSFERAYRLARPGQTVKLAAGTYGGEEQQLDGPRKPGNKRI